MEKLAAPRRRSAWEEWGVVLALCTILALTIGGSLELRAGLSEVRAEIPQIEAGKLREGFIALGDVHRLEDAIDSADSRSALTASEREAIVAALDYLFLRAENFRKLRAEGGTVPMPPIAEQLHAIVAAGDAALSGDAADFRTFASGLDGRVDEARTTLIRYVDAQDQAQNAAVAQQKRALARMFITTAVLLILFGLVSGGTVLLLRAEIRANRRRMAAEEKIRQLAYFDSLTGLLNRTGFTKRAEEILARGNKPALFLLDIDNFKALNDMHGHAAGDAVLRFIGDALGLIARENGGIAGRLGGDEFVVMVPGPLPPWRTGDLGQRMIHDIGRPIRTDGRVLTARSSIGICRADLHEGRSLELHEMLKSADLALYEAKAAGRNTYRHLDRELVSAAALRRELEEALPGAIKNGEFGLMFQPQVELSTGRLCGVEALVRWHRDEKTISPADFIPIAEQTGLICDIDLAVLRMATRLLAEWTDRGATDLRMSVNMSSRHFCDFKVVEHVQDVLFETGVRPDLLTLELTETALVESQSKATDIIDRLHELGVHVALDDFGAGYSGLHYLRDMKFDEIKVDRGFISRLVSSEEVQQILRALGGMAKGLGMRIVAEGVETERQADLVKAYGFNVGQGYFYARPQTAGAIELSLFGDEGREGVGTLSATMKDSRLVISS